MAEILIPFVHSFVVLDSEGDRLFAKYYDGRNKAQQTASEAVLHKKSKTVSSKSEADVLLVDDEIIVFKSGSECKFFISGPVDENELVLVGVLDALYDTVSTLLKGQVDKRTMLDNLELILLTIDETIDSGYIMELDATAVVGRVLMKGADTPQPQTIGDLSISQALGMAGNSFFKSMLSGSRGNDGY